MNGRTALGALALVLGLTSLAACDTGDGKELRPPDATTTTTTTTTPDPTDGFAADDSGAALPGDPGAGPFRLAAPWLDGSAIDARHTCDGLDVAPALSWADPPAGTVELAIAMVDESVVGEGQPFVHWVVAGLAPDTITLVEGEVPEDAVQALNFFGDVGYGGPCPPPGDEPHVYRLTAYALNQPFERADGTPATEFLEAVKNVTIGSADVTGTYGR